ncbi:MAG TPA: ABC transporter ATP-binding protein [Thermoanaerobaculia bacterium]|nr:ABC transporter ATP-binding protein [Thermoanaerobaculia bacterium]
MAAPSVTIEGLSKRFRIGAMREDYATLRDRISGVFKRRNAPPESREIWALRDIDFNIAHGEALGLIGHNGAGKSTLLKILSRITEPTKGRAILRGRVASLLEVGTGFHPELTGRENIYLNGAILGMSRAEIRANFDAIVAFAEVEKFLDTPVKRYSSGMFVRLAFAVAAHLTPEILLVDEVLAVGDIEFQRRCLGRMNEVARSGRTVVFVSHNLESIERLCTRAVLLRRGQVERYGPARDVVASYLSDRQAAASFDFTAIADREGSGRARISGIEVLSSEHDEPLDAVPIGETFRVRIHYEARERIANPVIGMGLVTPRNERVFTTSTTEAGVAIDAIEGPGAFECVIRRPNLLPGPYNFELWITDPLNQIDGFADHLRLVGTLELVPGEAFAGNAAALMYPDRGRIFLDCEWRQSV